MNAARKPPTPVGSLVRRIARYIPLPARRVYHRTLRRDDGTVGYATAFGAFLGAPAEAPVMPDRRVDAGVALRDETAVILTFGQSNAANSGTQRYAARRGVYAFNIFDMNYYRAIDPLPGATNDGGSVWGRLGDKLIEAGLFRSVLFVPIAVGGSFIKDWTPRDGYCYRRLQLALTRLKRAGIRPDMLCWHHGEADANHALTSAEDYQARFRRLLAKIRRASVEAPVYVAVASHCADDLHPYQNHEQIRRAQRQLVSPPDVLPGPDTDRFTGDFRHDGCHFSEKGLDAVAQAWLECIMQHPPPAGEVSLGSSGVIPRAGKPAGGVGAQACLKRVDAQT